MPSKPSKYGLRKNAAAYRKPIQWQVDSDYLDKLSPKDLEWMLKFQESEYGGNGHLMHRSKTEQRKLWVQQKKQQRDAMTFARYDETGVPDGVQPGPEDAIIEAMDRQTAHGIAEREERRLAGVAARRKKRRAAERRLERAKARRNLAKRRLGSPESSSG